MFVKFIDENTVENAPKVLRDDKNTYANPMPETLESFGYKALVEKECPNKDGYTYTVKYENHKNNITKVWISHEIVVEPEPVIEETPAENVHEDDESAPENVQESEIVEE